MANAVNRALNGLLPWHDVAWAQVLRAREAGRLPHALLLCGRPGIGKRHFAHMLGQGLLCRTPLEQGIACGECSACMLLAAGTHPDLRVCEIEVNEKTNKERTAITVDQVRELLDYLTLTTHYDGARIVIVDPADRMNPNAANALLKTLEEPPPGTLLILVSARPAALPGTILSRCQRVMFQPLLKNDPGRDATISWLASKTANSGHDPDLLLNLAGGAPLAAVALAGEGCLEHRQTMFDDLRRLASGQADPLQVAETWLKFGLQESLYWLYTWLVDLVRLKSSVEPPFMSNPDHHGALVALASGLEAGSLIREVGRVSGVLRDVEAQVSPQLLLEDALLGWVSISKSK